MSEHNVELIRRGFEHFLATGEPASAGAGELAGPDAQNVGA